MKWSPRCPYIGFASFSLDASSFSEIELGEGLFTAETASSIA